VFEEGEQALSRSNYRSLSMLKTHSSQPASQPEDAAAHHINLGPWVMVLTVLAVVLSLAALTKPAPSIESLRERSLVLFGEAAASPLAMKVSRHFTPEEAAPQDAGEAATRFDERPLGAYEVTRRRPAPFDAFLQGDDHALSRHQLAGLWAFIRVGCANCHHGALLGSAGATLGRSEGGDARLAPMLRNVAKASPYFHDGSATRLSDAVQVMAQQQLGVTLSEAEVANVVAFLDSLTGELPAHSLAPRPAS
jgi:hypothetical protein